ncbi:MAG: 1,4-dihydroxy-2-naphthoate polyprenyltransferase [Chloroflexota bacterium]|nr:1,4-dihydroxy-2-naphthoate polyprenyltransferase [Chloroflexota bacterium]
MQTTVQTRPSPLRVWFMAARPATLPAAVAPVLVGTAVAWRASHFRMAPFLAALVAAVLIQVGANFANDLFDFRKGADTAARLGPTRVTQSGMVSPRGVAYATALAFGLATLVGLYLVFVGGWPILLVGLASIAAAVAYTGGPYPLGYHGLGDIFVFVFFGVVAVTGTYYVQALSLSVPALVASVPMGLLITAILVVNNVRDIDTDRVAGKHTTAVRLGRQGTRYYYLALIVLSYLAPLVLWLIGAASWLFWLPWLTAPLAYRLVRVVFTRVDGPALNKALKGTGMMQLLFGVLFALAILFP